MCSVIYNISKLTPLHIIRGFTLPKLHVFLTITLFFPFCRIQDRFFVPCLVVFAFQVKRYRHNASDISRLLKISFCIKCVTFENSILSKWI